MLRPVDLLYQHILTCCTTDGHWQCVTFTDMVLTNAATSTVEVAIGSGHNTVKLYDTSLNHLESWHS